MLAVIGSYTSTATQSPQPIYLRAGVLQTSDATADPLTQQKAWTFFRNSSPNRAEAEFTADYLVNGRKYKNIVVLSDQSSYAKDLGDGVAKNVGKLGGAVTREFINAGAQDFTAVLTKIKAKKPDVLYFSGYYSDSGLIRAQQKQIGLDIPFVGGDANDNPDFLKLAGAAAAGILLERVAYRPLRRAPRLSAVVSALGASLLIENGIMLIWSPQIKVFPDNLLPNVSWNFGGAVVNSIQLFIIVASFTLMLGFYLYVYKTRFGAAIRACAIDQDTALLMGVNVNRVIAIVFIIGPALGALGGLFIGLYYPPVVFHPGLAIRP